MQSSGQKQPLTTFVEPAFFDDRHLVHGGSVTSCHLACDSSGQQDMQEARWTEHSLQDKRGACDARGTQPQPLPSGQPGSGPSGCLAGTARSGVKEGREPCPLGPDRGERCGLVLRDSNWGLGAGGA